MTAGAKRRPDVRREVQAPLQSLGFRKQAGGQVYTFELDADVVGWLGLNSASAQRPPGAKEINPVVGVRHHRVEELVNELRSDDGQLYVTPTVSTPIGYIMPEKRYTYWLLNPDDGLEAEIRSLVDAVETYALPFFNAHRDLSSILQVAVSHVGSDREYRVPVIAYLMGDVTTARREIDALLALVEDRDDLQATDLRLFAHKFLARLGPNT